jgi:serine phosphatase RsbU (regulator of sigma subunit)
MARTIRSVLPCFLVLLASLAHAQSPNLPAVGQQSDAVEVTLGQAAVPLNGPWKFTIGDSPIDPKTGQPLWAGPGFDDSHWETVDLTPKEGSVDPMAGFSGYVPGWTARGHADYAGYAWYRIRVRCQNQGGGPLAMTGPADSDDAYQAFADGKLLGAFGNFSGKEPVVYYTQPFQFHLPEGCPQAGAKLVLAFRFWMQPSTLLSNPDSGGMHGAPLLGEAGVIGLQYQSQWLEQIRSLLVAAVETVFFSVLAVMAFSLILFDRSDSVYLWIGLLFLAIAASSGWIAAAGWTQWIPIRLDLVVEIAVTLVILSLWNMVWWVWFGRVGFRWLPGALAGIAVPYVIVRILGREIFPGLVSHAVAQHLFTVYQGLRFVFFGLMVWIAIDGIRRKGLDGWLVLPVVLLWGTFSFSGDLVRLHLYSQWFPFGVPLDLADIAIFLAAVVIALLLLRRLLRSVKRQREMALDVKQAQEVQQVILPERRIALHGFQIETEYRPALEVGGDFFQIIPHPSDGSLLIVAGDVAGHGLKAGMLVALLIGAIRSTAEMDSDPAAILAALNRRLLGRSDAKATCAALRIAADGCVKLANAGHLPPYLNGELLEVEGSLPLGLIEGAESSLLEFQLAPNDRLLLVSDGVAEATNAHKELFGFDRVLELMRSHPSAARIADAAQAFGQEDDISVISVTRDSALQPAFL